MTVDTLTFQEFVGTTADEQRWQICNAVLEGGSSGNVSNSNVAVASDGLTRSPLNLDANGRLIVDIGSSIQLDNITVDLGQVESLQAISNALLTTIQSDLAGTLNSSITNSVSLASGSSVSLTGGSVSVSNFPATQPVSGTVTAGRNWNLATSSDSLTAAVSSLPAVSLAGGQTITASLANGSTLSSSISNFPAIQNVSLVGDSLASIPASLTAAVSLAGGQSVGVSSLPAVSVSNFPATQPVSGTVAVSGTVPVSGTFYQATQPVSLASVPSHAVTNAGIFAVQNTAATPAGTNFIGSVNPDSTGSGSVTTSVPFVVTVTNSGTLAFQSDAAATGNVTIEASVDGTNYTATTYTALTTGNTSSSFNAATATIGQIDTSGFKNIRFRSNTIVGTVGITYNLSKNVSNVMLDNPLPAGSNVIGQVTANAGTNLNTSALALETGGNLATVATKMSDGTQTASIIIPASFKTGQAKIAVTGTAVQLASNTLTQGVLISALSTNTASITIGTSSGVTNTVDGTGNGSILTAGSTKSIAATNTNLVWFNGTAGDIISFIGS